MEQDEGYQISKILLVIGGIIAIVLGATAIAQAGIRGFSASTFFLYSSLLLLAVGIIALIALNWIKSQTTAIVLAVLGFIAGGVGGVLIAVGGIAAIITRYALKQKTSQSNTQ